MAQYRKKPIVIEATQWFRNGDHPLDACTQHDYLDGSDSFLSEGAVVRYYPKTDENTLCQQCERLLREHGWIETLEGGHIVCPGDWVITGVAGEVYPCKPAIFAATYEPVEEEHNE